MVSSQRARCEPSVANATRFDPASAAKFFLYLLVPLIVALIAGCGGGGSSTPPPQSNPVPSITSLSPAGAVSGSSPQTLTINGSGFIASSSVSFNGLPHGATFVSAGKLTITLNQGDLASIGSFPVTVTNPQPGGGTSPSAQFQVAAAGLTVNIIDLPSGAAANVTVTGPNGNTTAIASSQIVFGQAGIYSVKAVGVAIGADTYRATTPSQSVNLAVGQSDTVTVDYYDVIPNTTKTLDAVGMQTMTVSPDGNTITLSGSSFVAQSLQVGDVLVSAPTLVAPHGLLRKVATVSQSGSNVVVVTTPATLADEVKRARINFSTTLVPPAQFASSAHRIPKAALMIANRKATGDSISDPCLGPGTFTVPLSMSLPPDASGNTVNANGEVDLCSLNLGAVIDTAALSASLTVSGQVYSHVVVEGRYLTSFDQTIPLSPTDLQDYVVCLGNDTCTAVLGLPDTINNAIAVITPVLTPYIGIQGNAAAGFYTGKTEGGPVAISLNIQDAQATPSYSQQLQAASDPSSLDGNLSVKGFGGVQFGLEFFGSVTDHLDLEGYLQMDANTTQSPWWTLKAGDNANFVVTLSLLGFFSHDFTIDEFPIYSTTIASAEGPFSATPTLNTVTPNSAVVGSQDLTLWLSGTNFVPGAFVSFNGHVLQTNFVDTTDISATLPATDLGVTGTYPLTVTNPDTPGATSNSLNFTVSGSITNPVPSISSLSPNSAPIGTSSEAVTINGQNFLSSSTVTYNGISHSATFVNPSQLTISLTANDLTTAGSFAVVVTNPSPGGGASNAVDFAVGNPVPAVTSLSPSSVTVGSPAQALAISGSNFLNSSAVSFNGSTRTPTFVNGAQLTIGLTTGDLATAGTYPVSVTNPAPGGGMSNIANFTVAGASAGSVSLSPTSVTIPEGGAQTFTASVAGSAHGVTWSVQEGSAGGTILSFTSTSTIYSPPSTTGTFHIVATNTDDSTKTATATVTVTPPLALEVLHSFLGSAQGDGAWPASSLIQASNGNFYGTTTGGGTSGAGTVFTVDTSGTFTTLVSFTGSGPDQPDAGLTQAVNGHFYGTSFYGGTGGRGTVFSTDASGNITVLHSFTDSDEGANPYAGLTQAADGSFFGTTFYGNTANGPTAFKVNSSGNVTFLHSFSNSEGAGWLSSLIQANDSNFYGTAYYGGASGGLGDGTIYRMDGSGTVTVIHSFSGSDGGQPFAGLVQASDGYLYGTTRFGGAYDYGTVFKLDTSGNLTVLHSFSGMDGGIPLAGLIQGSDGSFYGTTSLGPGTIFRMDTAGNVTVLHFFGSVDGSEPEAGLVQGNDKNLYGTTYGGGAGSSGVVFRLDLSTFLSATSQAKPAQSPNLANLTKH